MNRAILKADILHFQVTDRLRDMIVSGELVPGDSISEKQLCELFGISRTPLREALKVLASENLIDLLPRRGAVVTEISAETLSEKFQVAQLIEVHAMDVACIDGRPEDIDALEALTARIEASVAKEQVGRYFEASGQFHRKLVEMTGNRTLIKVHSDVMAHLTRARLIGLRSGASLVEPAKSHRSMMKAINRKNPELAKKIVTEHLARVQEIVLAAIARGQSDSRRLRATR